jgi:signal transduction histidine kinase
MKDNNLIHIGSLIGGVVHNLNTPLMWVMGRAQLIQSRNERLEALHRLSAEELAQLKEKNEKDIKSILEGADKIDSILKALGFKVQMVNEGYTSVELREYLENEMDFLMADMQFKHNTKREISIDSRSCYVKVDYNALTGAVTGIINTMINNTEKGRTIRVSLENGVIHLSCPEMISTEEIQKEIDAACSELMPVADILIDNGQGMKVSIAIKDV